VFEPNDALLLNSDRGGRASAEVHSTQPRSSGFACGIDRGGHLLVVERHGEGSASACGARLRADLARPKPTAISVAVIAPPEAPAAAPNQHPSSSIPSKAPRYEALGAATLEHPGDELGDSVLPPPELACFVHVSPVSVAAASRSRGSLPGKAS